MTRDVIVKAFNTSALSRRSFLTSLLATTTLPAWAQTIPTNPDVVIIGAGSAGLSAARTLIAQGKSVVIVEGADRIGGRAYTESDTFGVPYDHGCFNVMGPKKFAYLNMAKEWGFDLHYMKGAGEAVFVNGRKATPHDDELYDYAWTRIRRALDEAGKAGLDVSAASVMPDDIDRMKFAGLCQTWIGPMDFSVDFKDLSVQDWWQYGEVPSNYMIKQGYGALVARMGENLPVKLNLNRAMFRYVPDLSRKAKRVALFNQRWLDGLRLCHRGNGSGLRRDGRDHSFSEPFPRLEIRYMLWRQGDWSAGLGIASHATRPEVEREGTEAANLNSLTAGQARGHVLDKRLDRQFNILTRELW